MSLSTDKKQVARNRFALRDTTTDSTTAPGGCEGPFHLIVEGCQRPCTLHGRVELRRIESPNRCMSMDRGQQHRLGEVRDVVLFSNFQIWGGVDVLLVLEFLLSSSINAM